jgi:hypothetical protein
LSSGWLKYFGTNPNLNYVRIKEKTKDVITVEGYLVVYNEAGLRIMDKLRKERLGAAQTSA